MNIKLLATLSVAIALVSALTMVSLYGRNNRAASPESAVLQTSLRSLPSRGFAPSPDVTEGSAAVTASVQIGKPGDVKASVQIL